MGEIARTSRAQRFIDEFSADLVPNCPGDEKFTLTRIHLALRESTQEVVCVYVFVSDKDQHELVLEEGLAIFDPEYNEMEDVIADMEYHQIPDLRTKMRRVFR
jgi:hypothetical protein